MPSQYPQKKNDEKKIYSFRKQLEVSHKAEQVFMLLIEKSMKDGRISLFSDVRDSPEYQGKDIDFVCQKEGRRVFTYEIKNDTYTTGNIFAEYAVNSYTENDTGSVIETYFKKGWLYGSDADFVFYYFEKTQEAYLIRKKQFAAWVDLSFNRGSAEYETRPLASKSALNVEPEKPNQYYLGIGYLVPTKTLLAAPKMKNNVWKYIIDYLDLDNGKIQFHMEKERKIA